MYKQTNSLLSPVGGFALIYLLLHVANQILIEVRGKRKEREEGQSTS